MNINHYIIHDVYDVFSLYRNREIHLRTGHVTIHDGRRMPVTFVSLMYHRPVVHIEKNYEYELEFAGA